jgi:hypothetical protein
MMVCYDGFFPEVARELTNRGAEVIAWPVWGCNPLLARARATENHVYLISSTYTAANTKWIISGIYDHKGDTLVEGKAWGYVLVAEVDLDQRTRRSRAVLVQGVGQQLLAGTGLAQQQDRGHAASRPVRQVNHFLNHPAFADQARDGRFFTIAGSNSMHGDGKDLKRRRGRRCFAHCNSHRARPNGGQVKLPS